MKNGTVGEAGSSLRSQSSIDFATAEQGRSPVQDDSINVGTRSPRPQIHARISKIGETIQSKPASKGTHISDMLAGARDMAGKMKYLEMVLPFEQFMVVAVPVPANVNEALALQASSPLLAHPKIAGYQTVYLLRGTGPQARLHRVMYDEKAGEYFVDEAAIPVSDVADGIILARPGSVDQIVRQAFPDRAIVDNMAVLPERGQKNAEMAKNITNEP